MEEVYKDRDQFASLVREVAAPDVGRMGIEILSFTIKDVYDNVTYLASLGSYHFVTFRCVDLKNLNFREGTNCSSEERRRNRSGTGKGVWCVLCFTTYRLRVHDET